MSDGNTAERGLRIQIDTIAALSAAREKQFARCCKQRDELLAALVETWRVIDAAGLNLARGVELGQTSWFIKASDAQKRSCAAISDALPGQDNEPADHEVAGGASRP